MANFNDANQARLSLKMKFSQYAWYDGSAVTLANGEYIVVISVSILNNQVRKLIPPVFNGVYIRTES
jgi:hypothetical protein